MNDLSSQKNADPATPTPPVPDGQDAAARPAGCPRCGGAMTDLGGPPWCAACGYCALLETQRERQPERPRPREPSKLGAAELFSVIGRTPAWLWLLVTGLLGVIGASLAASYTLPEESMERVHWSLGQLLFGVAVVVAAHVWAIALVPAQEVRASGRGSWSLLGLWRAAASHMPETRWPVNLVSWGLTLILCAVLVTGGFGWWVVNGKVGP